MHSRTLHLHGQYSSKLTYTYKHFMKLLNYVSVVFYFIFGTNYVSVVNWLYAQTTMTNRTSYYSQLQL